MDQQTVNLLVADALRLIQDAYDRQQDPEPTDQDGLSVATQLLRGMSTEDRSDLADALVAAGAIIMNRPEDFTANQWVNAVVGRIRAQD